MPCIQAQSAAFSAASAPQMSLMQRLCHTDHEQTAVTNLSELNCLPILSTIILALKASSSSQLNLQLQRGCLLQEKDRVTAGDIYAEVHENSLLTHKILVPPGARGTVSYIAPAGEYNIEDEVLVLEFGDTKKVRASLLRAD